MYLENSQQRKRGRHVAEKSDGRSFKKRAFAHSGEDIMHLVKRVDMVADWSRESTRVLSVLPMEDVPKSIRGGIMEMAKGIKECAILLQKCVNKLLTEPEEALQAAGAVEREEEKVDDLHEKVRMLLGRENLPKAGVAVLVGQLLKPWK